MTTAATSGAAHRSASAQRLLDAALELFTQHGFEGTSLQLIADRLQVTKAAVYYHFRTKDEILQALVDAPFRDLEELIDRAAEFPRSTAGRELVLRAYVDYLLRHRRFATYLARDVAALSRPAVWEATTSLQGRLESLLTGGDDELAHVWQWAVTQALVGALVGSSAAADDWLRGELLEIGRQLLAGYRRARRRHDGEVEPGA